MMNAAAQASAVLRSTRLRSLTRWQSMDQRRSRDSSKMHTVHGFIA